jgi:hypothetical protein
MPADQPISLSDEALTAICQMCRPLTAPARSAFLEALTLVLAGEPRPVGDGAVFRHARALLRSGRFERAAEYHAAGEPRPAGLGYTLRARG